MPTDLRCPHCDLLVSIGGYFTEPSKGFSGATLLPCGACGTQHVVRHGIRDNRPQHFDIQKIVVDSYDPSALDRVVVRIQKFHKPRPSLPDALAIARATPFTLLESLTPDGASNLVEELKQIGVQAHRETTGRTQNPFFGLSQSDIIEYHAGPQHGDAPVPWLEADEPAPAELSAMRCMVCHSSGTIIETVPAVLACPSCRQANLVDIGFWLT